MGVKKRSEEVGQPYTPAEIERLLGTPWCRFSPFLAAVAGTPHATLLLAFAINKAKMSQHPEKWWRAPYTEIFEWTRMTRRQIDSAIETLKAKGILYGTEGGHNKYHLNYTALAEALQAARCDGADDSDSEEDLTLNPPMGRGAAKPKNVLIGADGRLLVIISGMSWWVDPERDIMADGTAWVGPPEIQCLVDLSSQTLIQLLGG
jgi:hypothetical protein